MSTLYKVQIGKVEGPKVDLLVRSMQPDSAPLYDTPRFALALLCDAPEHEGSRLAQELPPEASIAVSEGAVDPSPYVASVQVDRSKAPLGRYMIIMTSEAWTEHLRPGNYDSIAWDDVADRESIKPRGTG